MFQIIIFSDKFCWRRRIVRIAGKSFSIIAGHRKKDTYELWIDDAIHMQGYLVGEEFLYMIPNEKGVFHVHDMIFAVNKLGIWCGFK